MERDSAAYLPKHTSEPKQATLNLGARINVCPIAGEKCLVHQMQEARSRKEGKGGIGGRIQGTQGRGNSRKEE